MTTTKLAKSYNRRNSGVLISVEPKTKECALPRNCQRSIGSFLACAFCYLLTAGAQAADKPVTLLAAASTKDAVEEIADRFHRETDSDVRVSTGGSNALAAQIIHGAGADIFLSANQQWADYVAEKGFAAKSVPLVSNDLVVVVPAANPSNIKQPTDLLRNNVRYVALAGEKVPAGIYAEQALKKTEVYDKLLERKRIVRGQDVRATLTYVERGEADAAVVYATDALVTDKVEIAFLFDPKTHDKIVYPLVLLKQGSENPAAVRFFEFLLSAPAQKVFEQRGFKKLAH